MNSGVYWIRNIINGKMYIGSTEVSFKLRWNSHRSRLNRGIHHAPYLQRAWKIYGKKAFVFEILELCEPERVLSLEQEYIDRFDSANNEKGYNTYPVTGSRKGVPHTEESKRKMSESHKKKLEEPGAYEALMKQIHNPEVRKKWGLAQRGKPKSKEATQKMAAKIKERMTDPEVRAHLSRKAKEQWSSEELRVWRAEQTRLQWEKMTEEERRQFCEKRLEAKTRKKLAAILANGNLFDLD